MHAVAETKATSPEPRRGGPYRISLATSIVIVTVIAAECALVVQIRRNDAAVPSWATPVCPEAYATPVVLLWVILGSMATYAWRLCSVTRFASQVAVTCVLVMSRLWLPSNPIVPYEVLWPVAVFGVFLVTPLWLRRFSRISDSVLVLADSSVVALLTYYFALERYIPKM
jgi:hypothetical protein